MLLDSLKGSCGDNEVEAFLELRNINLLLLEVWILSYCSTRVVLSSTSVV